MPRAIRCSARFGVHFEGELGLFRPVLEHAPQDLTFADEAEAEHYVQYVINRCHRPTARRSRIVLVNWDALSRDVRADVMEGDAVPLEASVLETCPPVGPITLDEVYALAQNHMYGVTPPLGFCSGWLGWFACMPAGARTAFRSLSVGDFVSVDRKTWHRVKDVGWELVDPSQSAVLDIVAPRR